ncbi:hypothetical protein [Pleionea sp. CnH1-48]|uniref:hypothetical protein n=1 Tax=Pleionea sp. CnH1-48 TaxID=2954494 RepID=UPI0020971E86|nr:hypothetical protein [Pleionea sp. CnH1-48]MCO7224432.1 hypothetical protein [Pleionea sp. CnH1-48]
MKRTTKIILSVILVLFVAVIIAIYSWWQQSKEELDRQTQKSFETVQRLSKNGNSHDCISAFKDNLNECSSLICQATQRVFISQCLDAVTLADGFCDDVPQDGILESVQWASTQCSEMGDLAQACAQVLVEVPRYCERLSEPKS